MTTTPPAIISKMIIYMSEGSLTTNQLLMAIQEYLNGLDNIIMPDKLVTSTGGNQFCESPPYGHFVVVVNKMMGSDPDEKLQEELMNPEPEFTEDARTRNKIRRQLEECFEDGVTVHGLPILTVPSGKTKNFLQHPTGLVDTVIVETTVLVEQNPLTTQFYLLIVELHL